MNEMIDFGVGLAGLCGVAWAGTASEVVNLLCTLAITVVTCGLSIYRMIRDRDKDKNKVASEEKQEHKEEE